MDDLFLINGCFHTQDPAYARASAVAIRAGRFWAVGGDDEIRAMAGPGARVIDLQGRRVIPGLADSHFHYYDWALGRRRIVLTGVPTLARLQEQAAQASSAAAPGHWLIGQGWNETAWPERRLPSRADLDGVAPANPVILWRTDLHLAVVNSQALLAAGITADTPNPPQGVIDRDPAGQPTGILRDLAINLVSNVIPDPPDQETAQAFKDGFAFLHSLGLTGVHDQRLMGGREGAAAFRAWQLLQAAGEIDLRVWMNIPGERLDEAIALGIRTGMGDDCFRVGHCKYFSDGAQGVHTAWMLEPYDDADTTGLPLTPIAEIADALHRAHAAGLAIAVHAIGDRANREVITVLEQTLANEGAATAAPPRAPHRIEHLQNVRPEDLQRLAQLGVVASMQPIGVTDDIPMMAPTIGSRARYAHNLRSIVDAGIPYTFNSDCPVSDPNPFWGIHAAVTRRRRDGTPAGGWYPEQRLTVAEAVWGYSMGAAIVSGRQAQLGSISPGKLADLVVIDRDIFAIDPMEIAEARPVMTMFDGRIVYEGQP